MEIARVFYAVVSCALVTCVVGKTVSLNELIESESKQIVTVVHTTTRPKIEDSEPETVRFSLNKGLKPFNRLSKKYKETGTKLNLIPLGKRISPLQYRKTFQIKSPFKPKRVRHSLRTRYKRKNQSVKREIDGHALLNQKYIPLLKSLGMLFDNMLGSESSESIEQTKHKRKRLRYILEGEDDIPCTCPKRSEPNEEPHSEEEADTSTTTIAPEVAITTETPASTTDHSTISNQRSFRHHQIVPLLLPRNTASSRRNHHGVSEGGRAAHYGSPERYITGDHGDSEYNARRGEKQPDEESYEDNTDSDSRYSEGGTEPRRADAGGVRYREHGSNTEENHESDAAIKKVKTKKLMEIGKSPIEFHGPNKLKNKRDKAKSGKLLSKSVRGERGFLSDANVVVSTESIQPEVGSEESIDNDALNSSSDQRFFGGNGSHSAEDQKVNARVETRQTETMVKTTENSTESSKTNELESVIKESTQSEETDGYDKDGDVNIEYDSINEPANLDIINSSFTGEQTKENIKSDIAHSKEDLKEPVDNFQHTLKPKVKSLYAVSTETIDSDEGKAIIEYEISEEISNEDKTKLQTTEAPNTKELKPPGVEIPAIFSTISKSSRSKGPMVMIIDGYSVTRHKNGENKLSEKSIRIRP